MAYETKDGMCTITCDKCNKSNTTREENAGEVFYNMGYVLNKGRKYMHLCFDCLPKKRKQANEFVKRKFS